MKLADREAHCDRHSVIVQVPFLAGTCTIAMSEDVVYILALTSIHPLESPNQYSNPSLVRTCECPHLFKLNLSKPMRRGTSLFLSAAGTALVDCLLTTKREFFVPGALFCKPGSGASPIPALSYKLAHVFVCRLCALFCKLCVLSCVCVCVLICVICSFMPVCMCALM